MRGYYATQMMFWLPFFTYLTYLFTIIFAESLSRVHARVLTVLTLALCNYVTDRYKQYHNRILILSARFFFPATVQLFNLLLDLFFFLFTQAHALSQPGSPRLTHCLILIHARIQKYSLLLFEDSFEVVSTWLDLTWLGSTQLDSTRLDSTRLDSTRLDSTRLDSTRTRTRLEHLFVDAICEKVEATTESMTDQKRTTTKATINFNKGDAQ
jgi:hypothetical protein